MKKRYYIIRGGKEDSCKYRGLALVIVSGNKIKSRLGDKILIKELEPKEGVLYRKSSSKSQSHLNTIIEICDIQFDIYKEKLRVKKIEGKEPVEEKY